MGFTPEQTAAQEELEAAIIKHSQAFRPKSSQGTPEMVADWTLVVNIVSYDADGARMSAYNVGYSNGEMDEHRALGLLHIGQAIVMGDYAMAEDEEG